mmetsp:Transcript_32023/g.90875  ORF Transcript_32023/g.90875 Transcript_32023/m.90875 type:complete len:128 (+) Transcript_32023:160-543(+)
MLPLTVGADKRGQLVYHLPSSKPRSLLQTAVHQLKIRSNRRFQRWLRRNSIYLVFLSLLAFAWLVLHFFTPHSAALPSLKRSHQEAEVLQLQLEELEQAATPRSPAASGEVEDPAASHPRDGTTEGR